MRTALKMGEPARENRQQPVDVYLDVDGVIIPVFDPDLGVDVAKSGWRDWREPRTGRGRKRVPGLTQYSPVMIHRLRTLGAMEHVQMHWCTTWRTRAHDLARAVGLPTDWPVIDADMAFDRAENENRTVRSWWKRDAIQAHHEKRRERALVWIDDDLGFDEDARLWLRRLGRTALGVTPETTVGLSSHEFRRIERFVLH